MLRCIGKSFYHIHMITGVPTKPIYQCTRAKYPLPEGPYALVYVARQLFRGKSQQNPNKNTIQGINHLVPVAFVKYEALVIKSHLPTVQLCPAPQ